MQIQTIRFEAGEFDPATTDTGCIVAGVIRRSEPERRPHA